MAQETSSSLGGSVVGPQGNAASGTKVTITHIPSGSRKVTVVGSTGQFSSKGLRVGGPYLVEIDSDTFQDRTINDVYLNLGETLNLDVTLEKQQQIESIIVTASALSATEFGDTGPASNFDLSDIQNAPAINRDLTDIIRADPRVFVDETNNGVQCAGSSPRFNNLTLDGVTLNDSFGLNSNGYPTTRQPFSFDAIEQISVQLAPFDVQYGNFTACSFNAVTKSGTNELVGSAFFDYTNDSLKGDKVDGQERDNGNFTEKRFGINVGFPLIKDTLFFFGAYEKLEGAQLFNYSALGSRVTQAEVDRITQISQDVYGYDPGGTPASAPVEDESLLVKLDWNINDDHRASFVYNYNDGFVLDQSDESSSRLPLSNHFYERGAELNSMVVSLYSDWSNDFSTEFRLGKTDLDNRQISTDAASGFAEVQIRTPGRATVYLGPDDSRQSNDLNWDNITAKLAATYYLGDHTITGGVEYVKLNVFNLFVQHTQGEYRFNSIEEFEAGDVDRIYYNNSAGTNNPADAGANFSYSTLTAYIQDEFDVSSELTIKYGLRYDSYSTGDIPTPNAAFASRYGFSNDGSVDGISLLQPRVGFTYTLSDSLEFRGGFGLFSGGNPNVWISNAYSNDGVTNIGTREFDIPNFTGNLFTTDFNGEGRPIFDVPQALFNEVRDTPIGSGDGQVNATAPDFDIPSEWKYSLGLTYISELDYVITADYLINDREDAAIVTDLSTVGTDQVWPDGRPVNVQRFSDRRGASDLLLTNVRGTSGSSKVLSVGVSKEYDNGVDFSASYAYTEANDVHPMTSAVAFSNFIGVAVSDPLNPQLAASNFEVKNRFTLNVGYVTSLFDGLETRINLFGTASEGQPYSLTYDNARIFNDANSFRSLIYIPTENDPAVAYGPDFDLDAFNQFIDENGLARGQILPRNAFNAAWWTKFDIRVNQELPAFSKDHRASAFFVIKNLGNLLNDDWGTFKTVNFSTQSVVTLGTSLNDAGQFVYEDFVQPNDGSIERGPSLWEIRVGIKYDF
jgi:outer membrane receptor for ferrienterochelin and colicin